MGTWKLRCWKAHLPFGASLFASAWLCARLAVQPRESVKPTSSCLARSSVIVHGSPLQQVGRLLGDFDFFRVGLIDFSRKWGGNKFAHMSLCVFALVAALWHVCA
mmetsp:Transcript_33212/g.95604  ORF Transcript_33212/g.95604 Transcript_33212/m.95604 type:complete len:105 (+) Transcript_33212:218-532(+)